MTNFIQRTMTREDAIIVTPSIMSTTLPAPGMKVVTMKFMPMKAVATANTNAPLAMMYITMSVIACNGIPIFSPNLFLTCYPSLLEN